MGPAARRRGGSDAPRPKASMEVPAGARATARSVFARVGSKGAFSNRALSAALERSAGLSSADRALATELVYGVLRRKDRLDRALEALSDRGLGGLDERVRDALRLAAYQILFLDRIPAHAAVNDAVEACKREAGKGVGGLANALLRRLVQRGEPPLPERGSDPLGYLVDAVSLPAWLARLMLDELGPVEATALGDAMTGAPPLSLRANTLRIERDALELDLAAERPSGVVARSAVAPDGLVVRHVDRPFETSSWKRGLFTAMDAGAQVVTELCGAAPGDRILDACAGLGGKTAHLAALAGNRASIVAADLSEAKLRQARASFHRLGVQGVETLVTDLRAAPEPGSPRFTRVLLDAPCSGLGVLRRHPEAIGRRRPEDLARLAEAQRVLLESVALRVERGGVLVYAVCSFARAECEGVVEPFLAAHSELRLEAPELRPGGVAWDGVRTDVPGLVRLWPHHHDADAFFAARFRRS